jgi:tRNA(Ile)-lysidine synthase
LAEAQSGKKILSETHQLLKNRNCLILTRHIPKQETMNTENIEESDDSTVNTPKFYEAVFKPTENNSAKKVKNIVKKKVIAQKYEVKDFIEVGNEKYKVEQILNDNSINFRKRGIEYFDADTIAFPLYIRGWQAGDYFFPLGMNGKKKLSDYFVDIKLSVFEKEKIWLLCDANDQILWVIGYRIDNRFKVTSTTQNLLKIYSASS